MKFLGPGIPLYFQFLRHCFVLLLIGLLVSGIYSIYENGNVKT